MSIAKPLSKNSLAEFLDRFENFKDSELISINVSNPLELTLSFKLQDKLRDFDWIALDLTFFGIKDAILPDDKRIKAIDLSEGVSILEHNGHFAFSLSECDSIECIQNTHSYIISKSIKTTEKSL